MGGIGQGKETKNLNILICLLYRSDYIVILNWQRPLQEGDQAVVKRSGRDESIRVVIHMHGTNARNLSV
jgi:hypothetical protein